MRTAPVDAKSATSPPAPRAWSRLKGIGSALSLRKLKSRDSSVSKSQHVSREGVRVPAMALVGAGGEGTHVGGRPRTASVESLQRLSSPPRHTFSQRGQRAQDLAPSPSLSQRGKEFQASPSPGDSSNLTGLLRKFGVPGGDSRPVKAQPRRVGNGDSNGMGEGGICRSIAEFGEK